MENSQKISPMKIQLQISKEKNILGEVLYIPLSKLKLDPNNVRFKHLDRVLSEQEIEEQIYGETDTRSLLREIRFSNGLSEPPYVQEIENGDFKVLEGNRRTVCLRKIAHCLLSFEHRLQQHHWMILVVTQIP